MANSKKHIVVIGAGVAGLTIAYLLAKKRFKVTVIEKESEVGGLARSFSYGQNIFDIGPHRFHTDDKDVMSFIEEVLGDNIKQIVRKSKVWLFERYHDWPLRPSILAHLPLSTLSRVSRDLIFKKPQKCNNFEDFIIATYGKTLYDVFFKPYTKKFLKESPSEIDSTWARVAIDRAIIDQNLKMSNLWELIKNIFFSRNTDISFLYPKDGGIGAFPKELKNRIQEKDGAIFLNSIIKELKFSSNKIEEVISMDKIYRPDIIIWTAPITTLCRLLNLPTGNLCFLSLVCYNFLINSVSAHNYQWCYFGDEDVSFSRTSIPILFSKSNAQNNKMGICVEVPCLETEFVWQNPQGLVETIKKDLLRTKQIDGFRYIQEMHIEKIPDSYPIYELGYEEKLNNLRKELNKIGNLILLGRSANFWYNNMDHSIKAAMNAATEITNNIDG